MDQERFVSIEYAIVGVGNQIVEVQGPGRMLMFVMRIIGKRFHPSVRMVPPERGKPIR